MDYGILGEKECEEQVTLVLVIRERRHQMTRAMLVPRKGAEFPCIARISARFIDQLGHNRVALRCDKNQRLRRNRTSSSRRKPGCSRETACGRKPVQCGIIERAVELVAGQARTLKAALEPLFRTRVLPDARILCWLVELGAYLTNRCDIGSDGKTLQRLHGRRDTTPILEFGEKILYMPAKPARGGKWEPRFHPRVLVGMLNSSSEAVVVTEQGTAIKTRSANVRRIPESERWDADRILGIQAVPWSPDGSDNAFDIQVGMERSAEMVHRDPGEVLTENMVARTYFRTADFEQWGLSECCP